MQTTDNSILMVHHSSSTSHHHKLLISDESPLTATPPAKEKNFHEKKFWGRISKTKTLKMLKHAQTAYKYIISLRNFLGAVQKLPISHMLDATYRILLTSTNRMLTSTPAIYQSLLTVSYSLSRSLLTITTP